MGESVFFSQNRPLHVVISPQSCISYRKHAGVKCSFCKIHVFKFISPKNIFHPFSLARGVAH